MKTILVLMTTLVLVLSMTFVLLHQKTDPSSITMLSEVVSSKEFEINKISASSNADSKSNDPKVPIATNQDFLKISKNRNKLVNTQSKNRIRVTDILAGKIENQPIVPKDLMALLRDKQNFKNEGEK
jgi:hypothetical protein